MVNLIKKFLENYESAKKENTKNQGTKQFISNSLTQTLSFFKNQFGTSEDLTVRKMEIMNLDSAIITMAGLVDKETLGNNVMNRISADMEFIGTPIEKYEYLRDKIISSCDIVQVSNYEDALYMLMSGFALVAMDGCDRILAIGVQGYSSRGISEPSSEVMQRGSREGFVEPLRINMTMIRRRIKNPTLKFETSKVGNISKTEVCFCYMEDKVSPDILDKVKHRMQQINLETIMAAGYVMPYLEEENDLSLFSSIGMTERPDTVCGKLAEGRIAIIIDGTPNVLIVPYLFTEYFQSMDDYAIRPYFATLSRLIKYIGFFIASLLPGLYVGIGTFNPELLPGPLLGKVAISVGSTPFSLLSETLLIHFFYELMREAGLRLPKPLGHAVSIMGGLVIGDTAIKAGLIGAPTLMVVALTALSSYVIPNLYEPIAMLRLLFIIAGGIMGIWGVMILFAAGLVNICSKTNYGIPFTAPISPLSVFGMRDVFIRAGWKILAMKDSTVQYMPGAHPKRPKEKV